MSTGSERFKISVPFVLSCLIILYSFSFSFSSVHAGGYIESTLPKNYLTAPGIGADIIAYVIGDYVNDSDARIHFFVRRCECLKRLSYTDTGIFITYNLPLTKDEFNGITPEALTGMVDFERRLTDSLSGSPGLIAVIVQVLEYKKDSNSFAARVKFKFVAEFD